MANKNTIEIVIKAVTKGEKDLKEFKGDVLSLNKLGGQIGKGFALATAKIAAFVGGLSGVANAVKESITLFASFDDTMRQVAAVSGATGDEFQRLTDLARQMGEETRYTATESAQALKFLSMAGLDAAQSMEALPGSLSLLQPPVPTLQHQLILSQTL